MAIPRITTRSAASTMTAVVCGLGMLGAQLSAAPALAVDGPAVKLSASQWPKIVDNAGTGNDFVRITNVPHIRWNISFTGGDESNPPLNDLSSAERFVDIRLPENATSVDVSVRTSAPSRELKSDVVAWNLPYSVATRPVVADAPVAQDLPGKTRDSIRLSGVPGLTWSILSGTTKTDLKPFVGTKSFSLRALKVGGTTLTAKPVIAPGYTSGMTSATLMLTDTPVVNISAADVEAAVGIEENLPGRTRDTVSITPVPGIKWSVCGGRSFAVAKPAVKSASCSSGDGTVAITAVADKGYSIAGAPTPGGAHTFDLPFVDDGDRKKIAINGGIDAVTSPLTTGSASVGAYDALGTTRDALYFKPVKNVVWQYGYKTTNKAGDLVGPSKWATVGKSRSGQAVVTVPIKAAKTGDTTVVVRAKAVNSDYVLTNWPGDRPFTFKATKAKVNVPQVEALADHTYKLPHVEGLTAWKVVHTMMVNKKSKSVSFTVKVAPYSSVGVKAAGDNVKISPVLDKDHEQSSV